MPDPRRAAALSILAVGILLAALPSRRAIATQDGSRGGRWYKGNTHTHTVNSDGDSTPDDVVRWYREHGYQFLVLTDHNFLTGVDGLNAVHGADDRFLVVKGEEVTDTSAGRPIHINGLDVSATVPPQHGGGVVDVVQRNIDAIRKASGIPHVNHPNFGWAISADDMQKIARTNLFEIYNGHHAVNNLGGGGVPGMEEVWDRLLSSGKLIFGIADDDAHVFKQPGNPDVPGPGRGWVFVRAERLAARPIVEALDRGDFYASTGVELTDYQVTARAITLAIKPRLDSKYRVQFIGKGGQVLSEVAAQSAEYVFRGDEMYVRVKIFESNGRAAWTQPVWRAR